MDREKRKQPCPQCRRSQRFAYERGEYADRETISGVSSREWSNCCGDWIYLFSADTKKMTWRRPTHAEGRVIA